MIVLLSPTKQMDFSHPRSGEPPLFKQDALRIVNMLRDLDRGQLAGMMKISESLAEEVFSAHQSFGALSSAALFAFSGTVFKAVDAATLSDDQVAFAQKHIRILSALYGLLKPLDAISPYRLQMADPFRFPDGQRLVSYWKPRITELLMKERDSVCVNLASEEFSKAVDLKELERVVTIQFKLRSSKGLRSPGMRSKMARGAMISRIIRDKIDDPHLLKHGETGGYRFEKGLSDTDNWVFVADS